MKLASGIGGLRLKQLFLSKKYSMALWATTCGWNLRICKDSIIRSLYCWTYQLWTYKSSIIVKTTSWFMRFVLNFENSSHIVSGNLPFRFSVTSFDHIREPFFDICERFSHHSRKSGSFFARIKKRSVEFFLSKTQPSIFF